VGLEASFQAQATSSRCYEVVETVPSGLVPIDRIVDSTAVGPSSVAGQRVTFCVPNDPQHAKVRLQYTARVVNEGTFTWEPAILQLPGAPEAIAVTGSTTLRIGAD